MFFNSVSAWMVVGDQKNFLNHEKFKFTKSAMYTHITTTSFQKLLICCCILLIYVSVEI